MKGLAQDLGRLEVVVCCGSGGVGKTTVSAALAMAIARRYDKRVLVLTVDPARRLATALGIEEFGLEPVVISAARLRRVGMAPKGEVSAAMLDMKTVWDRLVDRYAPSAEVAHKIRRNRFYQGISEAFVGSHEFMAMEELYELHNAAEYDCIVVDTPPSRSALDFLDAPAHMSDFIGGKLLSWLAGGSRLGFRALNLAARPLTSMADRLVGTDVLDELAEFVGEIQLLQGSIKQHSREMYRLLRSPVVGFVVVSTLEPAAFEEAEYFAMKLREYSMPLRAVVVNRELPAFLADAALGDVARHLVEDEGLAADLKAILKRDVAAADLAAIGSLASTYNQIARRDAKQHERLEKIGRVPVASIPLLAEDLAGLEGLALVAAHLDG